MYLLFRCVKYMFINCLISVVRI